MPNFVIFRPEFSDTNPKDWNEHLKKVKNTVQEITIICENQSVATVEVKSTGFRYTFNKWPKKYWGVVRGIFKSQKTAEEALNLPNPVFDHDGHLINKISKSQS